VVGYSRLMGVSEIATLAALKSKRVAIPTLRMAAQGCEVAGDLARCRSRISPATVI
jgi:hypothetical protein